MGKVVGDGSAVNSMGHMVSSMDYMVNSMSYMVNGMVLTTSLCAADLLRTIM